MAGGRLGVWWCGPGEMPAPMFLTGEPGAQRGDWAGLLELAETLVPAPAVPPVPDAAPPGLSALRRHLRGLGHVSRCPRAVVLLGGAWQGRLLRAASGGCAARLLSRRPDVAPRDWHLAWAALQEGHPVLLRAPAGHTAPAPLVELSTELGVPLGAVGDTSPVTGWTLCLLDAAARAGWGGVQAWLGGGSPDEALLAQLAAALRPAHLH